jgi:hypothetical protein
MFKYIACNTYECVTGNIFELYCLELSSVSVHKIQTCFVICATRFVKHVRLNLFFAFRAVDADHPVCYARRTRGFLGDISNLAPVSSNFSSVSTCLLRVILLFKFEHFAGKFLRDCKLMLCSAQSHEGTCTCLYTKFLVGIIFSKCSVQ